MTFSFYSMTDNFIAGFNFNSLENYVKTSKHVVLPPLQLQQPQKQLNMLAAGSKQPLSVHIPQHFPQFPDPHAYVRTPVSIIENIPSLF